MGAVPPGAFKPRQLIEGGGTLLDVVDHLADELACERFQ